MTTSPRESGTRGSSTATPKLNPKGTSIVGANGQAPGSCCDAALGRLENTWDRNPKIPDFYRGLWQDPPQIPPMIITQYTHTHNAHTHKNTQQRDNVTTASVQHHAVTHMRHNGVLGGFFFLFSCDTTCCHTSSHYTSSHVAFTLGIPLREPLPLWP